jgi:hypothetical protein
MILKMSFQKKKILYGKNEKHNFVFYSNIIYFVIYNI